MHSYIFSPRLPLRTFFSPQGLERNSETLSNEKSSDAKRAQSPAENTCKRRHNNSESCKGFFILPLLLKPSSTKWCSAEHLMPDTTIGRTVSMDMWAEHVRLSLRLCKPVNSQQRL